MSSDPLKAGGAIPRVGGAGLAGHHVVITGAAGQLGGYLGPAVRAAGGTVSALGRHERPGIDLACELTDREAAVETLRTAAPDVIIHAAACTDVDGIERDPARGHSGNTVATANVAAAAVLCGAYLIAVSTDMVFPGDGGSPYAESAKPDPISAYGHSKLAAERSVLSADPSFAVARTAWLYGGAGKHFPRTVLTVLRGRGAIEVVDDEFGSPTFAGDLADALVILAALRGAGLFHLVNEGRASRYELAWETARAANIDPGRVLPIDTADFLTRYPLPAKRPPDSTLLNSRAAELGIVLRDWRAGLADYVPALADEVLGPDRSALEAR